MAPLLKLGTRRSPLAMAQAEEARARLCAAHGWAEHAVELVPVLAILDLVAAGEHRNQLDGALLPAMGRTETPARLFRLRDGKGGASGSKPEKGFAGHRVGLP